MNEFLIKREPHIGPWPYVVWHESKVAHMGWTLYGARWWVRHRGARWIAKQRKQPELIERIPLS